MYGEKWYYEKDQPYSVNYKPILNYKVFGTEPECCDLRTKKIDGSEIAKELGISDAAVSTHLRRALSKMYFYLAEIEGYAPFDAFVVMSEMLSVCFDCQEEVNRFWALLPDQAREMITNEAKEKYKNSFMC